jgi:hypothetical protein
VLASGCAIPFVGPSLPSTADLVNGAATNFSSASSVEVTGAFNQSGYQYTIDMQVVPPSTVHLTMQENNIQLEAVQLNGKLFFRGADFLAKQVRTDPAGQRLAKAIGAGWFSSKATNLIDMSSFTDAAKVKANFLNTMAVKRQDTLGSDGVKTAELTGPGYTLNITEVKPYRLVSLRIARVASTPEFTDAELAFTNYNKDFGITAPTTVFDLDDHSTWPPLYFRVSMSPAGCNDPCTLSAVFQNDGGTAGAPAPSTVLFTLANQAGGGLFGSCTTTIRPDVPNGAQVTQSCGISSPALRTFTGTYIYNAVVTNPAYD